MVNTKKVSETQPRNTKKRGWSLTVNNFTEEDIASFKARERIGDKVIAGIECGTQGTQHIQGYISFENARSFDQVKAMFPTAHIEPVKNANAMITYCKKDGNLVCGGNTLADKMASFLTDRYKDITWRPWQQDIIDIIDTTPDDRTVHWFYEDIGNTGKSFLARFIHWKYPSMICEGKKVDIFNGFKSYLEEHKDYPQVCLLDIPRCNSGFISWSAIEEIKNGLFYSGKYEGGVIELLPLHVICFANFMPPEDMLSQDRWRIVRIL